MGSRLDGRISLCSVDFGTSVPGFAVSAKFAPYTLVKSTTLNVFRVESLGGRYLN